MKNPYLLSTICLLTISLVSCGEQTISKEESITNDSQISITSTSSDESLTTHFSDLDNYWTDEEVELMKEHLGNNIIPYIEMVDYELYYDSEFDCISINKTNVEVGFIDAYYDAFINSGFKIYDLDDTGSYYGFRTIIDDYYFECDVYCLDENENFATSGYFCLDAYFYIPFENSWPQDRVELFLQMVESSETIPVYIADKYIIDDILDEMPLLFITCYSSETTSKDCELVYKEQLEALNYTIEYDEEWESYVATSFDSTFTIDFYYDISENALSIVLMGAIS